MYTLIIDRSTPTTVIVLQDRVITPEGRADSWTDTFRVTQTNAPDRLAVGLGPGSFAGIRSAIAFLQGLGIGLGLKPVGYPSAALLAGCAVPDGATQDVHVVGDARRGTLWTASFRVTPEKITQTAPFTLRKRDTFVPVPGSISPDASRLTEFALAPAAIDPERTRAIFNRFDASLLTDDPVPIYLHPAVGAAHAE